MANHDKYGKDVLRDAAGALFKSSGADVEVDYGVGAPARIDGAVASKVAVEIESRVSKQVRGAILDLVFHRFSKKLLVLMPVHMSNPDQTAGQCRRILGEFVDSKDFRVVLLRGSGSDPRRKEDSLIVREALSQLGIEMNHSKT